jgi:acyl-CoA thioester hydrolase
MTSRMKKTKGRRPCRSVNVRLQIPFHDVDSMGVVWHGHYFKYFEIARTAFFRRVGFDVNEMKQSGYVWPVIESHCRYAGPLQYGMTIVVTATLKDAAHRIKMVYTIRDPQTGRRLTHGYTVQATVNSRTGELCLMTPQFLLNKLG